MRKSKSRNTEVQGTREVTEGESIHKGNMPESQAPADDAGPPTTGEGAAKVDTVEELRARVESLEDALLRAKADFQNFQRRSDVERADAIRYANAELLRSLLSVLDDFERSLEAAEESDNAASVVDGVRLVYENLLKALQQHGLETIQALHRPFDPHVHEAVMQQPSTEHPPGTVLQETIKGYRLRDRVIRPTKVVVSRSVDVDKPGESDEHKKRAARDE